MFTKPDFETAPSSSMLAPVGMCTNVSVGLLRLLPGCSLSLTALTGWESVKRAGSDSVTKSTLCTGYHFTVHFSPTRLARMNEAKADLTGTMGAALLRMHSEPTQDEIQRLRARLDRSEKDTQRFLDG